MDKVSRAGLLGCTLGVMVNAEQFLKKNIKLLSYAFFVGVGFVLVFTGLSDVRKAKKEFGGAGLGFTVPEVFADAPAYSQGTYYGESAYGGPYAESAYGGSYAESAYGGGGNPGGGQGTGSCGSSGDDDNDGG